jgi:hypothetical protein
MTEYTVTQTVKKTGQIIEFPATSSEDVVESIEIVDETINAYRSMRQSLYERGMKLLKEKVKEGKND